MKYLAGLFALIFVAFNGRRIYRDIRGGASHFLASAAGDGLLGYAARYEQPLAFWRNIIVNIALVTAVAGLGAWVLFGQSDS
jgi:hypothetical protein